MNRLMPFAISGNSLPSYENQDVHVASDTDNLIGVRDLLRVIQMRWPAILALAAAVTALSALAVSQITPVYMGAARVIIEEQRNHVFNPQTDPAVLSDLPSDPSSIENQVQMLQSHALAGQVVDKLGLINDPDFNGMKPTARDRFSGAIAGFLNSLGLGGNGASRPHDTFGKAPLIRERAIGALLSGLDVHAVGLSTIIEIDYRSASPQMAARIANAMATTYMENQTSAKSGAAEDASLWLADRVTQLARQKSAADAAVQTYKAEHGIVDTSNGVAVTDQQLGDLTGQLIQAQSDQAQADARQGRAQMLARSGHSADVTDVVTSPLIGQLRAQQATLLQEKANLSSRYGPLHPAMQNVEARIHELDGKIAEEVNRIAGTTANDAAVASARVAALRNAMAKVTSHTATQNQARIKLGELEANATSAQALYQSYLDRLNQTQQQASLKTPDVRLASPASVPMAPASPKKLLIIGGSALVSLVLGFLGALAMDRMSNGFRAAGELEAASGLPVLATIPELKSRGGKLRSVATQVIDKPQSQFSEAVRGLEIALALQDHRAPVSERQAGKVLLVTSALPGEGKTSTTVNLARRLSASGHKVVVVDADQRRPSIAAALGLRNVKYGLADYLARRCSLDQVLAPDPLSALVALPASSVSNASELIGSTAMMDLIARLREVADFVIIDSPPVLAVHDARLLAQLADAAILVVRWDKTPREAAALAARHLREFHIRIAGAVLARTNIKHCQYYTFGYAGAPALAAYYEG